jgi:dTDP-4-amino-4,6-dideoxygalactose transaminase
MNPFTIIEQFEAAICDYTGAPYAVAVNSCTNALLVSLAYWTIKERPSHFPAVITIPKRTYVSVPMTILHCRYRVTFDDRDWVGIYRLNPAPIWDCARRFTSGMFPTRLRETPIFQCVSFHWTKPLGIQHGGAILHNCFMADEWLRRARFDGRLSGEPASAAKMIGWHCLTTPEVAAAGLVRIANLPRDNPDSPKPDYPDLSQMEIFK